MRRVLVTGGCGFIGCNFLRLMVRERPETEWVNLDALTYAGWLENTEDFADAPNYRFVHGSIEDAQLVEALFSGGFDAVVNFAAESHVDRSIAGPRVFVETNVLGTQNLLEAARRHGVSRFLQISTDEVYGSLGPDDPPFTEETPLRPNSPYAASKASADLLCRAYHKTYGMDVLITRCSNNYGPYQYPEKLIPSFIRHALRDEPVPLYGDGMNVRDWLHVEDHCRAVALVLERGRPGRVYNVGGGNEHTNLEITRIVLDALGKPHDLISFVTDRPGHDRRYATDSSLLRRELGWRQEHPFERGIRETVAWYVENAAWAEKVSAGLAG
ncbi:dTDP-glucose 4,6-dehydratase [Rubrobacter calidifluminis]|uniref:dTDP-glucose 4,6-dehydratase n=1 Tax=Rubrobacter calidifluminis TaxID=1392640 RepID=UPI00235F5C8F|nr:dTDP-glucose 4,6-dehydratase [Rubrobacter calidifluminis]